MHQCSNDADERLDTLRRHFNERLREMERRYNDKERAWRETFSRLRAHLGVGAVAEPAHEEDDAPGLATLEEEVQSPEPIAPVAGEAAGGSGAAAVTAAGSGLRLAPPESAAPSETGPPAQAAGAGATLGGRSRTSGLGALFTGGPTVP
ncbi:unnamed protein product [Symbiodinium pilosum]|uniref:Uncharacterized protein n=1 Tax=Symbiodinium pilosum TaxID=2952 RepID=A0A812KFN9_SYMPI|nr:unnamed protein product [Symbiodinium pilosum]